MQNTTNTTPVQIKGGVLHVRETAPGVRVITTRVASEALSSWPLPALDKNKRPPDTSGRPAPACYLQWLAVTGTRSLKVDRFTYRLPGDGEVYFWQSWPTVIEPAPTSAIPAHARQLAEDLCDVVAPMVANQLNAGLNEADEMLVWLYHADDIGAKGAFIATFDAVGGHGQRWKGMYDDFINLNAKFPALKQGRREQGMEGPSGRFKADRVIAWDIA